MTDRDLLKQALDALERGRHQIIGVLVQQDQDSAIEALRAALAQGEQEPVAVVDANDEGYWADILPDRSVKVGQLLYTAPPQREWVGLTDEEAADCWSTSAVDTWRNFEAALREKNT